MKETSLHSALKGWNAQEGGQQEVLVDGYWIDVVQGDMLIEIQTRQFSALKPKLADLLDRHPLRLVHPIAQEKWIVTLSPNGHVPDIRRKSPRHGRPEYLFLELVRFPQWMEHPNFSLEILLTREEEIRRRDGHGSWRRGGASIVDRRLIEVLGRILFTTPDDLLSLLPSSLPQRFTNRQLSNLIRVPLRLATRMTYCLRSIHMLDLAGKSGRANLYSRYVAENKT